VIDPGKKSHQIIAGLKTHNWYRQNPALALLDKDSVKKMTKNSLFVLGRNIYQAACGNADAATQFVKKFMNETSGSLLVTGAKVVAAVRCQGAACKRDRKLYRQRAGRP
jgi:hypothetical protein